jgi:FixJ family two-component response regulator
VLSTQATVFLVDDDAGVRDGLSRLFRSAGWQVMAYASALEFLDAAALDAVGCIVLDVRMPGMGGPELHDWICEHRISLPVIYLSGHCDVPMSVRAMKHGAHDVLQKPADDEALLQAVGEAVERHRQQCLRRDRIDEMAGRLSALSTREREVMVHVIHGRLNKQIAADLGIAEKTVKVHRGRAMAKMRVRSVAELVHICDMLEIT